MAQFKITKNFIPGLPRMPYRFGFGNPEGIVLHETGAWGGTDTSNRAYELVHWDEAYVHFFVDWNSITQVAPTDYVAWGAGWYANQRFIHVELVRTRDPQKFRESYRRYVWLIARLLHEYGLKPKRRGGLWTHYDVTRFLGGTSHTDPKAYLAYHGVSVAQLINDIQAAYNGEETAKHVEYETKTKGAMVQLLLNEGDRGADVRELQKKLKARGFYGGNIDGIYGGKTESAVREFQRKYGLQVDGIAGPKTLGKLEALESNTAVFTLNGRTFEVKEVK